MSDNQQPSTVPDVQPLSDLEIAKLRGASALVQMAAMQDGWLDDDAALVVCRGLDRLITDIEASRRDHQATAQELERVGAEAAMLREALQTYAGLDNIEQTAPDWFGFRYDAGPAVRALTSTTAGASLLAELEALRVIRDVAANHFEDWRDVGDHNNDCCSVCKATITAEVQEQADGAGWDYIEHDPQCIVPLLFPQGSSH
jgi:hypothetical protein